MAKAHRKLIDRVCVICGADFQARKSAIANGQGTTCSRPCTVKYVGIKKRVPIEERFWKHVNKTEGCWIWTGALNSYGYGTVSFKAEHTYRYAHRVSWELAFGPIPEGLFICHHCDNPPCVRPDHLFLGTLADNNTDCLAKDRVARGNAIPLSKLTAESVSEIRRRLSNGESQTSLALEYGVTQSSVSEVANRKSWTHVE